MTEQKRFSAKDLWNRLLDLDPRFSDGSPDIDMLSSAYKRHPESEQSKLAKDLFENALKNWDDEQIREFIWYLSEQKPLTEITSLQLHSGLKMLYEKIFEK